MGYTRKASRSRSRKGGSKPDDQIEVDIEHGFGPKETAFSLMEKGRSMSPPVGSISPPVVPTPKKTIVRPSPIKIDKKTAIVNEEASQMEQGKSKFSPKAKGDEMLGGRKRTSRKAKKTKKHFRKGSPSKTRKGRKDFVTHKGDKKFHRRGHRQSKPQKKKSMIAQLLGL